MKSSLTQLRTEPFTTEREWDVEGIPVLRARICLPQPAPGQHAVCRRVRRYYQLQGRAFLRYCQRALLPRAQAEYQAALAASRPLPCLEAELTYRVTFNRGGLWSLYTQSRESGPGGQTLLLRRGDTWNLAEGYPVPLSAFLPRRSGWKRRLIALAAEEIQRRERAGMGRYPEDWRRRLRRHFSAGRFYLTEEGLAFFYPMFALAPASEGIPVFTIPYGTEGVLPPPGADAVPGAEP